MIFQILPEDHNRDFILQPEYLPPTSAATVYPSLRVHHQIQQWGSVALLSQDWGWQLVDGRLLK